MPINRSTLIRHLEALASDEMEGRESGTPGIARARQYIRSAYADIGLLPVFPSFEHPFVFKGLDDATTQGINLVGMVRGRTNPEVYIVVSAHYDHLGRTKHKAGEIFSGADDNASGVAALLEIARDMIAAPPECSIVFCAFDGEEAGLRGSAAFVERAAIPLERIAVNVNLDMIGRADEGMLWASGTRPWPILDPYIQRLAGMVDIPLVTGHDRWSLIPGDNWTHQSDHGSFHDAGVPALYFGVSNHDDTHETNDEIANIDNEFFMRAATAINLAVRQFDEVGPALLSGRLDQSTS